ncbi:alanine racemase [Xanthobacter sp. KR7-225]|uniref:alanine racemase n=1 Tax=Xanthobacter sp. KR7-225 TaxID=3156613 RepID=UPI0032B61B46
MSGPAPTPEEAAARADALRRASAVLTIDLAAIVENWRTLSALAAPAECAAVVKADAYGLGVERVAPALWRAGALTFFVAHLNEGTRLRALLPDAVIYVLNGLMPGTAQALAADRLRPVLGSVPEISDWSDFCRAEGKRHPAAIHVDTGMERLGLALEDAVRLSDNRRLLGFEPSLLMSHLACADTPGHPLTGRQLKIFTDVARRFPGIKASLANSAGTLCGRDFRFDLVRPGIFLYGGVAVSGVPPLKSVVRLDARVLQVRDVERGATVGYGAAERVKRRSRIATVALGYADGLFRAAGSTDARKGAQAIVAGTRCPLVGRVSMDLATLDVTDLPAGAVERGAMATFLGEGIGIDELAAKAGTIGYEVLTALGARHLRRYLGE